MKRTHFLALTALAFLTHPAFAQEEERTAGGATTPSANYSETYRQLQLFGDVFERVRAQYVEPVEDKELIENAVNGMLTSLDPHSAYLDDKKFDEMQVSTKGEFGGLGIEVSMENGLVKVVSPIDDTPAFRAGVLAGDFIVEIDHKPVMGLTLNEAVDKMRGDVGSKIDLTLRREGESEPIEISIIRDVIRIRPVRFRTEGNAGYIRVTTFNQHTEAEIIKAIEEIKTKLGTSLVGYVLDLRNNPGGLLDQAIAAADLFLDKGEIVSTRGREEKDVKRDNATPGDMANGLPIVVLINSGSASASEIVAGALQDHKRGILLGTQSFGKGSVQTVIPIPGHGAMRLTTARYYTPSGRSIQAKGITPDITVEPAKIETYKYRDFHESELKGALDNTDEQPPQKPENKKPEGKKPDDRKSEDEKLDDKATPDKDGTRQKNSKDMTEEEAAKQDYQLTRALDLLNGLSLYDGAKR